MMPRLEYFIVCESVSVDQETNRVSLFNVVEEIQPTPAETPHPIAQWVAVSSWNLQPGDEGRDFQALVRIHVPDGEARDFPMNFRMENIRQRLFLWIQGVIPSQPGDLRLELLLNGQHVADHSITVHPLVEVGGGNASTA